MAQYNFVDCIEPVSSAIIVKFLSMFIQMNEHYIAYKLFQIIIGLFVYFLDTRPCGGGVGIKQKPLMVLNAKYTQPVEWKFLLKQEWNI